LIVTKVTVFGKIKDWSLLVNLVVFVVVDFYETLSDKVHLLNITFVADNALSWRGDPAIHLDNEFVSESTLTLLEEVVERSLKFFEDSGVLDQVSLHLWRNLLVELELLDD
jgi:hypothetical protein